MPRICLAVAGCLLLIGCDDEGTKVGDTDVGVDTDLGGHTDVVDDTDMTGETDVTTTPTCAAYCAAVTSACTDADAQYTDEASCNALCEGVGMEPGTSTDAAADTIGCRTLHAGFAAANEGAAKTMHCGHAGLLGGGTCGEAVANFCAFDLFACSGDDAAYDSVGACTTAGADWAAGTPGSAAGDTLACRTYHLGAAILISTTTHCPHTAADGGGVCVD